MILMKIQIRIIYKGNPKDVFVAAGAGNPIVDRAGKCLDSNKFHNIVYEKS